MKVALTKMLLGLPGPRHQVLNFHRVLPETDPLMPGEPTADWFDSLVAALARDFRIIPLEDAVQEAMAGRQRGFSISITFDDGYADNYAQALPILLRHGVPATFFIASGFLDGGCMWNDAIIETLRRLDKGEYDLARFALGKITITGETDRAALANKAIAALKYLPLDERTAAVGTLVAMGPGVPADLMLTRDQVATMAREPGMSIGGHTRNHPILSRLGAAESKREIEGGRDDLTEITGSRPTLFAYPNGRAGEDYLPEHASMVREAGFACALATDWGTLGANTDLYAVPRFTPWSKDYGRFVLGLARCRFGML